MKTEVTVSPMRKAIVWFVISFFGILITESGKVTKELTQSGMYYGGEAVSLAYKQTLPWAITISFIIGFMVYAHYHSVKYVYKSEKESSKGE